MLKEKTRIAVFVSGGGTNLQALIDAEARGELGCGKITLVIASKPNVYALERAKNHGVPGVVLRNETDIQRTLEEYGIDLRQDSVALQRLKEAAEKLKEQKSIVQGYVMDEIFDKMGAGEALLAPYYAGDALTIMEENDNLVENTQETNNEKQIR